MTDASQVAKLEAEGAELLLHRLKSGAVPDEQLLNNLGLFIRRQTWGRYAFMMEIYRRIVPVHGVVMEFGVRYGQNLALFTSFRGMFEPYNYSRRIVGFDTFEGFPTVHAKDGRADVIKVGAYEVPKSHEMALGQILDAHEKQAPIPHIVKHELVKGDVTATLDAYLKKHEETVVALAYFDLDLYEPTKHCLERIVPLMPKGAILAFDEVNYDRFPGETAAVKEVLGLNKLRLERLPYSSLTSFVVIE